MFEKILFIFLTFAVLYLLYKNFTTKTASSTTLTTTTNLGSTPTHALFTNSLKDASPGSAIAAGAAPIPKLNDQVISSNATIVSAFNAATATFTAPSNGMYMFDLTLEFANGRVDADYTLDFFTNAFGTQLVAYHSVTYNGYNKVTNTCRLLLQKGKTVQFRGKSSITWGNYQSSLYIALLF